MENKQNQNSSSGDPNISPELLHEKLDSVLEMVPDVFRNLIEEGFLHKRIPKEYTLSSILFAVSSAIGKHFYIEELGYKNYANSYFLIVGSRGDAKSEAINLAKKPITEFDNKHYKKYQEEVELCAEDEDPPRKQLLIQNATIEKAQHIHFQNLSGVGVYYDEVRPIIQKMINPNSRDGVEWLVFFLEGFTNNVIDISRKTTESFRIESGYVTMIGGIQNQFISDLHNDSLVASGFIDRLLFTTQITRNTTISSKTMSMNSIENYSRAVTNLLDYKLQSEQADETIKERRLLMTDSAKDLLRSYSQTLLDRKEQSESPMKEYYSKLMIYLHKLSIICFLMRNAKESTFKSSLESEDVTFAIELIEFYQLNFKAIISLNKVSEEPPLKSLIQLAKKNKAPQKAVVEVSGFSKGQVSKLWSKV